MFLLRLLRRSPVGIGVLLQVAVATAALANLVGHLVSLLCPEVYFSLRLGPSPGPTAGPDEVEDVLLPQGEALLVHQLGPVAAVVRAGDSDRLLDIERQEAGSGSGRVRDTAGEIRAALGSRRRRYSSRA